MRNLIFFYWILYLISVSKFLVAGNAGFSVFYLVNSLQKDSNDCGSGRDKRSNFFNFWYFIYRKIHFITTYFYQLSR
jgi:hypothetical protein